MKAKALKCPECGANLEIEKGQKNCSCDYCGYTFVVDDENRNATYNENITHTKRYINETKIEVAKINDRKNKRMYMFFTIILTVALIALLCVFVFPSSISKIQGKKQIGSCEELIGQNYKTVEKHFESAGFTNIETVDLNDSGIAFWNNEKVVNISVDGKTDFKSTDWYFPDVKVVISYH